MLVSVLTVEEFGKHPVWSFDDSNDFYEPVDPTTPLPDDRGDLLIKVDFAISYRRGVPGYVVGFESVFALGVFVGGREFSLNLNLKSDLAVEVRRLEEALRLADGITRLEYSSAFRWPNGTSVIGVIEVGSEGGVILEK